MMKIELYIKCAVIVLIASTVGMITSTYSCTRVLVADQGQTVMVGRNMDWDLDMRTNLWVYPRGLAHRSIDKTNPLTWTSRYGSLVATGYDLVVTDGINEKGLSAHMLWLPSSDYGERNPALPGLSVVFFAQFYIDNFATVDEAVRFMESGDIQITPYFDMGTNRWIKIHIALDDASGDSAVIEYVKGQLHIYHGRQYTILTNAPTYDKQLQNLKAYLGFGGDKPLPGTTLSTDRFVRAAYYSSHLPKANSTRDQLAKLLRIMENVVEPEGVAAPERAIVVPTIWRVIADLTHRIYYFNANNHLNMIWADLDKFNLAQNAPVMKLDLVNRQDLTGDVSNQFQPTELPPLPDRK